jgi:hypothetical protein
MTPATRLDGMTNALSLVPPPAPPRHRVPPLLTGLRRLLGDMAYGIHAGNAIRHGLPAPRRAGVGTAEARVLRPVR